MNHKDTKDTKKIQENILGLESPDEWACKLWVYHISQMQMQIHAISKAKNAIEINLRGVEYFEGATRWTGANFRLHHKDEAIKMTLEHYPERTKNFNELEEKNLLSKFIDNLYWKLYSIPTASGTVSYILAGNISVRHLTNN